MATFFGTTANETITGTNAAEGIYGLGGDDILSGQGGNDLIWGDQAPANTVSVGQEILVNTTTTGSQATPELVSLNNGGLLALWVSAPTQSDPGLVYGQFLDATGGHVGAEFQISTDLSGGLANSNIYFNPPSAVQLSDGNVLVAWTNINSSGVPSSVHGSIYDVNGVPQVNGVTGATGEFLLTEETNSSWQVLTDIAAVPSNLSLPNGGFNLQFQPAYTNGVTATGYDVAQRFYDNSGLATGPSQIVTTYTAWDQGDGEVVSLAGGGSVSVWLSLQQGETGSAAGYYASNIYFQMLNDDGTPNGVETLVHPNATVDTQIRPDVTALSDGSFVVTWQSWDYDGDKYGIYANHIQADGTLGTEFLVNQETTDNQRAPVITELAGGGYVITWQSEVQDGDGSGIYYRVYDANDVTSGTDMLATTTTAGDQMTPSIAALSGGGFAIAWVSASGQDGDDAGVYTQYFNADGSVQSNDGDDFINGGAGNDELHGNGGTDVINGNAGSDRIFGDDGDDYLSGNAGDDVMKGGKGDDVIYGNNGADKLQGNAGSDFIDAGNGSDKIWGGVGADQLYGNNGADRIAGGTGSDVLLAGNGQDKLFGGNGSDNLGGEAGQDKLFGGNGDDFLFGDGGQDYLTGGNGADQFIFNFVTDSVVGTNADHITDFVSGTDSIFLSAIDADTSTSADDAFAATFVSAFTGQAGELMYAGGILSGDVNGDGQADFEIVLDGAPTLLMSDIVGL